MRPRNLSRQGAAAEHGTVTAEAAVVLPVIAGFVLAMIWLITVGVVQVRVVDASRDAARAVARGDDLTHAAELARATAPTDAHVTINASEDRVEVTVSARPEPPGWLPLPLPEITVDARSVAQLEAAAHG
jgi:Flp pilus assembly protein TadG